MPYFDAAQVRASLPFERAIAAIEDALRADTDPEIDGPRIFAPAPDGEFLLMPAVGQGYSGLKVATIAPLNPAKGEEKIQGVYLLFDSANLTPIAAMDGAELTAIRTPAATLAAVKNIAEAPGETPFTSTPKILVFGAGIQAVNHIRAAKAVFPEGRFSVVGQRIERIAALTEQLAAEGIAVTRGSVDDVPGADVILCVTSSPTPLFDGSLPADHAIIASVGQHGLDAREVDETLVKRSEVAVEGRASSWRESGDLIPARSVEEWMQINPPNLKDLVDGKFKRVAGRPSLYTGVGMAWEDLVSAAVVYEDHRSRSA
nr:ornithine cyclodeaminase family protein [Paeniglutamicibacter psychrophenolicus]